MKSGILALAGAAFLAGTAASAATLDVVKERGELRCGVSQGVLGFSAPNDKGEWSGFDIDFCRAVAAAALEDTFADVARTLG